MNRVVSGRFENAPKRRMTSLSSDAKKTLSKRRRSTAMPSHFAPVPNGRRVDALLSTNPSPGRDAAVVAILFQCDEAGDAPLIAY
jgi:hypothetical protein